MGTQNELMSCYEQLAPLTEHMLELARAGNWDSLATAEAQFRTCVARLKTIEPEDALDQSQLDHKYQLLTRILADDAEIRGLISPQLAKLSVLLNSLQQQQNLHQAYGQ